MAKINTKKQKKKESSKQKSNGGSILETANVLLKGNKMFDATQGFKYSFKFPKSGASKIFNIAISFVIIIFELIFQQQH